MRKAATIITLIIALGAIAGWLTSGGGSNSASRQEAGWREPTLPAGGADEREKLYDALLASGHFGAPRVENPITIADADADASSAPPQIAATTLKDGAIAISVYDADGAIVTASVGGELPGGWIIEEATLDRVVVTKEGDRRILAVFPHEDADS